MLSEYEERTAWKYMPISGRFPTHPDLLRKIDANGRFRPFMGSTVVFRLERHLRQYLRSAGDYLADRLGDMLANPLPLESIHLTLHDLVCPEHAQTPVVYTDEAEKAYSSAYRQEVARSLDQASRIVAEIQSECGDGDIALLADRVVNMVSKSLVLLLKPATERDYERLHDLYRRFDAVTPLPYLLTPHVTLAYFRPGEIDGNRLSEAVEAIQVAGDDPLPIPLSIRALTAQRFTDMAHYADVPTRLCFCCDGGMNRSVMAAAVLNHQARVRKLPVQAEARAAFRNTEGRAIPSEVVEALARQGISTEGIPHRARFLDHTDAFTFTRFVAMTGGAESRIAKIGAAEGNAVDAAGLFRDLPDPQYGAPYDTVLAEIVRRMERFLDSHEE